MNCFVNKAARVFPAGWAVALLIAMLVAAGPSVRPASAADWYQVNVCADPAWLDWVETMDGFSNEWSLSGNCSAAGSEYDVDFSAEFPSESLNEEMAWIYPKRQGSLRAGLKIIYADVILAGNNGSDDGALQGIRFCGATCGDLITLSQPSLPEGQWERTVLPLGDARLPADATSDEVLGALHDIAMRSHREPEDSQTPPQVQGRPASDRKRIVYRNGQRNAGHIGLDGECIPQYGWRAEDLDSGVWKVTIAKKGTTTPVHVPSLGVTCLNYEFAGLCPTSRIGNSQINPADGIWSEGLNEVFVDVDDRAMNRSVRPAIPDFSFYVDRRNPTPTVLSVRGAAPAGWVSEPAITLDWTNEGEQGESRVQSDPHSGVVAVEYDFQPREEGQPDPAAQRVDGENIESADVEIPGRGAWDVIVRTVDAVGNKSAPMTMFVGLDDAVPAAPQIDPVGWVGSAHLLDGLPFTWTKPSPTPSGICGYGHSVDVVADAEAPATMSIDGDVTQATLPNGNVEGPRYLHLRAISCAGVSGDTAHRRFEADLLPPKAQANLADGTWTGQSSALRVTATDDGSGVQNVLMKIGGSTTVFPGSEAVPDLPEGKHAIEFSARDTAGNVSQPESLTIGVDRSAPVGFFDSRSSDRPALLSATVSDGLSGIRDGEIDYRPVGGSGEWTELDTRSDIPVGSNSVAKLSAYFPDFSQPDGAYEARARVIDRVGNVSVVSTGWDGTTARIDTPVREKPKMTFAFEGRPSSRCAKKPVHRCKPKLTAKSKIVNFGLGAMTLGRLVDAAGKPMAGRKVTLFAQRTGTKQRVPIRSVETDADGRFRARIKPGVNRRIYAWFDGNDVIRPAEDAVDIFTRSKLTLKVNSRRVRRGGRLALSVRLASGGEKIVLGRPIYVRALGTRLSAEATIGPDGTFRGEFPTNVRAPIRLMLQAHIPQQDGWPYYSGDSRIVKVHRPLAGKFPPISHARRISNCERNLATGERRLQMQPTERETMHSQTYSSGRSASRLALAAILALCAFFAFAAQASASSATSVGSQLVYTASTNETNSISITADNGTTLTLYDSGAVISTVTGFCTKVNSFSLTCPKSTLTNIRVNAGNYNDTVVSTTTETVAVYGSTGNDTATVTGGVATARGEDGNDVLTSGSSFDSLLGGNGNDTLDGGLNRDYFYGQAGTDTITYESRTNPVNVDLGGNGSDGEAYEDDLLDTTIENVKGGSADDVLEGGSAGSLNKIWGGAGNDTITSGTVAIEAYGQDGHDTITGTSSNDWIYGNEGDDYLDGGLGADYLLGQNRDDSIVGSAEGDTITGGNGGDFLTYHYETNDLDISTTTGFVAQDLEDPNVSAADETDVFEVIWAGQGSDLIDISGDGVNTQLVCEGGIDYYSVDAGDDPDANTCEYLVP